MKYKYKQADSYVTFIPTSEEFNLIGTIKGRMIVAFDSNYLKYGFKETKNFRGDIYFMYLIDSPSKLENLTNAYKLYYMAKYKGSLFHAGISTYPEVVIFATTYNKPEIEGFRNLSRGEWVKEVDASEVEIIPIKEEIDLSKYLPQEDK
ncbi:hypothetical protein EDD63_1752 [Breznakia blatticola]|uniref:Uncharacterized protein n=2 Tax=Breznakia blatticola TaxID=1754012 RepID=A0A4V3G620_9FIRM|nr:hypothetical protein EDD63_1752 [Breznakia blatticola]